MTVKSSFFSLSFALVVVVTAASMAQAQGQGGGRRGFGRGITSFMLLQSEQVQKELELTEDQKTSLTKVADEYRPGGGGGGNMSQEERQKRREELQKKVSDILTPQQQQRLDEIVLQVSVKMQPSQALSDSKVAEKLQLTEDQKQQLTDIASDYRQKTMDLFQSGGPPDREAMTKLRTEQSDKTMAVLTAEQKDQLTKMQGKTLDIDPSQLRGMGAGRGRNRDGGGNGGGGNGGGGKDGSGKGENSGSKPDA